MSQARTHNAALTVPLAFAALCAAAVAWSGRSANTDLYMALAGGRDVAAGKVGRPDEWSYMTQGRVWINQSWLTGFALCKMHQVAGESGLMLARTLLVAAIPFGMLLWLRSRAVEWSAALAAATVVCVVLRPHLMLRGNLVTLALMPWLLWLLERQRGGSLRWTGAIAVLLALWAQCHGGGVYAFGVVALWLGIHGVTRPINRAWISLAIATLVSAGAAVVVNPFGPAAFKQSLMMAGGTEWRSIVEWWPLYRGGPEFARDFMHDFASLGTFVILAAGVLLLSWRTRPSALPSDDLSRRVFDVVLILGTLAMTLLGRRFMSLATIALALQLARVLQTILARRPAGWLVAGALTLGAGFLTYPTLVLGYAARHPFYPAGETLFDRQVEQCQNPVAAARFLRVHGITGPVFHTYELEDYLYWAVPGVKVGCGGRAQQIYTEDDLRLRRSIDDTRELDAAAMQRRREFFDRFGIRAILLPTDTHWDLIRALIETGTWSPAFFDGDFALLLRADGPDKPLLEAVANEETAGVAPAVLFDEARTRSLAAQGKAAFPDELTRARTRALCATAAGITSGLPRMTRVRERVDAAQRMTPHPMVYTLLDWTAARAGSRDAELRGYYTAELKRLDALPADVSNGATVFICRMKVATRLTRLHHAAGDAAQEQKATESARAARQMLERLAAWWQM